MMLHLILPATNQRSHRESELETKISRSFNDAFCDVTFKLTDGSLIRAHRTYMGSNPYFKKMFEGNPKLKLFWIFAVDPPLFAMFVDHIYERLDVATVKLNRVKLYQLAETYEESALKKRVLDTIDSKMEEELVELYKLADDLPDSPFNRGLKRKVVDSISENIAKVSKTEVFKATVLVKPDLAVAVLTSGAE